MPALRPLLPLTLLASSVAIGGCDLDEDFTNSSSLRSAVTTNDPFEFSIGEFFIDGRNGSHAAWVITRRVEADGSLGEVVGANYAALGEEHDFVVHMESPMRRPEQRMHVAIYTNQAGNQEVGPEDVLTFETTIDVTFESSVINPDSPFFHLTCGLGDSTLEKRRLEHKTALDYDCRCSLPSVSSATGLLYNWDLDEIDAWSTMCSPHAHEGNSFKLGEGPQLKTIQGRMTTGDVWESRDEIIFGVKWGSLSAEVNPRFTIMAINYYTGERRVVSGEFVDPMRGEYVVGDGPLGMPFVGQVRRGPDGMIYAMTANHHVVRVDPETGDRERLWSWGEDSEYPQCDNGVRPEDHPDWRLGDGQPGLIQLSFEGRGFTVAPDGSFYVPTLANGVPRPGYGIVRIAADGSSCEHISRAPGEARNAYAEGIGQGFAFESALDTMVWHNDKLVAISVGSDTYEIDPVSGDRLRLAGQGLTGTPNLPRVNRMFWDPTRNVFVLTGVLPPLSTNILTWDPASHATFSYFCASASEDNDLTVECASEPLATLPAAALPGYLRPDGMIVHGFAAGGFHLFELSTGNTHWFAY